MTFQTVNADVLRGVVLSITPTVSVLRNWGGVAGAGYGVTGHRVVHLDMCWLRQGMRCREFSR